MKSISEIIDKRVRFNMSRGVTMSVLKNRIKWPIMPKSLKEKVRDYCKNSSLAGCRYLIMPHRFWVQRAIWIVLYATILCGLAFIVGEICQAYYQAPTVSIIDSEYYPASKLEFPGVAVCNANRISRRAAIQLATDIVSTNTAKWKFIDVLQLIKQLGSLYDQYAKHNKTAEIVLDEIFMQYHNAEYDITAIMKKLSPSCTDGLLSCRLHSEIRNCSEIFTLRKTKDGFCCTFNYIREPDDIPITSDIENLPLPQIHRIDSFGIINGLTLVLEPFSDDYFYSILPMVGWKVTIFNYRNYPGRGTGSIREIILSRATETFAELQATSIYSTEEVRNIAIQRRKCIFENETSDLNSIYTQSGCRIDCQTAAIWKKCKCRLFYIPERGQDEYELLTIVSGNDWDRNSNGNNNEISRGELGNCIDKCHPTCNDVRYYLSSCSIDLEQGVYDNHLVENVNLVNQSILHIYFTKQGTIRLKRDAPYYWYDVLSYIGGYCGLCIGFSVISFVEIVYFMLCTLGIPHMEERKTIAENERASKKLVCTSKRSDRISNKNFTPSLYWNEFLSHTKVTKNFEQFRTMHERRY